MTGTTDFYARQASTKGNDPETVVVSAALTGALTTREQCPAIPYTPTEIAEEAAAAREAGAAVAHIHARTAEGAPTFDVDTYQEIHDAVRDRTDIVLNFSTGAIDVPLEDRLEYVQSVGPEVAALNMGSMNYAKYSDSREDYVFDMIFENPFSEIRDLLAGMNEAGVTPELECFDTGHVGNTRPLLKEGVLERPFHVSLIMGVLGGIPATVENLVHQVRQLPDDSTWQVIGISQDQWPLASAAAAMGGNVRVGLEDNFYRPNGEMAESNAELVEDAVELVRTVGREPATPDEAREILGVER
ncbi:3-keto-5-aminohexanoate cleavage protein [Natrarchaeobaculum aegyptiacum]|uniref:3-keto-5-aminohexanoate cleavage protein n=1 Tax=Natrarchaeobaculum aegyptiacum TaxID=745377 RepID=A0A2Z2I1Z0_9EURY|nr:3-keto-5-aminohexanoate cleavage protein [Natrarchaeobaculum aegyptiacum]ARS90628.1 3-keto-5-aminohexanoate cleavage protein [Natrarchaeobaculum aegyptiacum]